MPHDVFISYSTKDKNTADAVCSILERNRIRCWIAPRDVIPGKKYAACIIDSIKQSKVMVVIFSSNSNSSDAVSSEIECAMKYGVVIIPVRIENAKPTEEMEYYLSSRHWLDALTQPIEQHIIKLAETVKTFLTPNEKKQINQSEGTEPVEDFLVQSLEEAGKSQDTIIPTKDEAEKLPRKIESIDDAYMDIDKQYAELLKIGLGEPDFRDYDITSTYYKLDSKDPLRKKYHIYANLCWNLIETIYDAYKDDSGKYILTETWEPVILEENKLHFSWFMRNLKLFKKEFQEFVIHQLNEFEFLCGNNSDLKRVYKKFEADFPAEERKPYSHIENLIALGKYKLVIMKHKAFKKDIGYAFVYENDDLKFIWLDYMAIDTKYQSFGLGSVLFNKLLDFVHKKTLGMFLEVEIPNAENDIQLEKQIRRINFYERLGAKRLDFDYRLPTDNGGFPMYLYIRPAPETKVLSKETIVEAIKSAYSYIHCEVADKDDILSLFVDKIEDTCL